MTTDDSPTTGNRLLDWLVNRIRLGPNHAMTREAGWRWYEIGWCLLIVGWFSTTGRPLDLVVAIGLISSWLVGPAVTVLIGGNLALVALQITPETWWALGATEFIFGLPIVFEGWAGTARSRLWGIHSGFFALIVGLTTAGLWFGWSLIHVAGGVCGLYISGLMRQRVYDSTRTKTNDQRIEGTR